MDVIGFLSVNKWTFMFYAALIYVIYFYREKLDWQAKFIGLYRTQFGLKFMATLAKENDRRHSIGVILLNCIFPVMMILLFLFIFSLSGVIQLPEEVFLWIGRLFFVSLLAYLLTLLICRTWRTAGRQGVIVGFIGMIIITLLIFKGVYDFLFIPEAPPTIYPALPGISVPGIGKIPLVTGWIALFIVIVIHEFSHGVVSKAHKIPVKSSGLVVFGPLGGAFVEPDEKKLQKAPMWTRQSVFAAGPYSNILTGFLFILLIFFVLTPLSLSMTTEFGVQPVNIYEGSAAANASLPTGVIVTMVNYEPVTNMADFIGELSTLSAGEIIILTTSTGDDYDIISGPHPDNPEKAYIGAQFEPVSEPKIDAWWYNTLFVTLNWFLVLLLWTYFFSLGIGLANLLPIAITDGGRMFQIVTHKLWGEKHGNLIWMKVSSVILIIIVLLLVASIGKQIF